MRVYHFLPAKWALDDLENKRLKIATFDDLNDPFELFVFNVSNPVLRRALKMTKEHTAGETGFLCFSRNWKNPLLWSHYADKHRGVCLGFDIQADVKPVNYTEKRLEINLNSFEALPQEEQLKRMKQLLLTKYLGWAYEDEVRAHTSLEERDTSTGLYYFEFGENLKLKEIIAGPLCSVENRKKIKEAIGRCSETVEVIQARLAFRSFDVVRDKRGFRTAQ